MYACLLLDAYNLEFSALQLDAMVKTFFVANWVRVLLAMMWGISMLLDIHVNTNEPRFRLGRSMH